MQESLARHETSIDSAGREKPRLLFILHGSIFENYGGVEYYLDDLISMATEVYGSDNVRVVAPLQGVPKTTRPYSVRFAPRPKSRWLRKVFNRIPLNLFWAARNEMEEFNPTVVIGSHVALGPLVYGLARQFEIPYLSVVYGIECWGNLLPQDEWALRRAQGILSISHWTKNILVKRGYPAENIALVPPRLPAHLEHVEAPPQKNQKAFRLLTVSRLDATERYKGHDHVLKALGKIKKSHPSLALEYVILGDGTDKSRLEALSQDLGLADWVIFRSAFKDRSELAKSYEAADVFIMPSRFGRWERRWRGEGFGIVYVEAAAFEVPSIAYRCGGAAEIIEDEKTGLLVEPDNLEALAAAILKLALDPHLRQTMGVSAKQRVMSRYVGKNFSDSLQIAIQRFSRTEPSLV